MDAALDRGRSFWRRATMRRASGRRSFSPGFDSRPARTRTNSPLRWFSSARSQAAACSRAPGKMGFELLGQFAGDENTALAAENRDQIVDAVENAMARFVQYPGGRLVLEFFDPFSSPRLGGGKKTREQKSVRRQSGNAQSGCQGARAGNGQDFDAFFPGGLYERISRVRDQRSAGVRNQRDTGAVAQHLQQLFP